MTTQDMSNFIRTMLKTRHYLNQFTIFFREIDLFMYFTKILWNAGINQFHEKKFPIILQAHKTLGPPMTAWSATSTPASWRPCPKSFPTWNTNFPSSNLKCSIGQRDPALCPWPQSCPMLMIVSWPQDMPTTPSILRSTALTEASHNANKFSSRNYYFNYYY